MDVSSENDTYTETDFLRMTPELLIPSAIGMALLGTMAVGGNLMTVIAYIRDKRLHTVYDFYIFNLAITDFLIGSFSLPFYAWYTLTEFTWHLGITFCKVWLVVDFTLCFESILLMLLLSLDRLLLISFGPAYSSKVTLKKAYLQVALTWLLSFLLYGPSIIGWDVWVGHSTVEHMDCDVEFAYDVGFTTVSAVIEFVLPFVVLTILNTVIYFKIRGRLQVRDIPRIPPEGASVSAYVEKDLISKDDMTATPTPLNTLSPKIKFKPSATTLNVAAMRHSVFRTRRLTRVSSRARRDSKSARFLATLVVVFLVCWTPYTVLTITISICGDDCISLSWYEATNWILWLKSAINPFLYAMNSSRYRYNFQRLLCCLKRNVAVVSIETTFQTAG